MTTPTNFILVVPVDTCARLLEIDAPLPLEKAQKIVGGYVEVIHLDKEERPWLVLVVNEDGKLQHLDPNFSINGYDIVGTAFFAYENSDGTYGGIPEPTLTELLEAFALAEEDNDEA